MKNIIILPQRGPLPQCPVGYEPAGSPYIFRLKYIPCHLRMKKTPKCQFKQNIEIQWCPYKKCMVTPLDCLSCPLTEHERSLLQVDVNGVISEPKPSVKIIQDNQKSNDAEQSIEIISESST